MRHGYCIFGYSIWRRFACSEIFTAELAFHGAQRGVTRVSLVTACNATVSSVAPLCTEAFPAFFARACVARVHFTGFPVFPVAFARFLRVSIVDRFALLAYLVFIVCPVSALVFTSAFRRLLACTTLVIYIQFPAAHIAGKILDSHNLPSNLPASVNVRFEPILSDSSHLQVLTLMGLHPGIHPPHGAARLRLSTQQGGSSSASSNAVTQLRTPAY